MGYVLKSGSRDMHNLNQKEPHQTIISNDRNQVVQGLSLIHILKTGNTPYRLLSRGKQHCPPACHHPFLWTALFSFLLFSAVSSLGFINKNTIPASSMTDTLSAQSGISVSYTHLPVTPVRRNQVRQNRANSRFGLYPFIIR